ncbi:MAG: hypothetical protein ACT4NY_17615 [Pseudonocardiales bacterium]
MQASRDTPTERSPAVRAACSPLVGVGPGRDGERAPADGEEEAAVHPDRASGVTEPVVEHLHGTGRSPRQVHSGVGGYPQLGPLGPAGPQLVEQTSRSSVSEIR